MFQKAQLSETAKEVCTTVCMPAFWLQVFHIHDLAFAVHGIRRWGAGCSCHQQERKEGKVVTCQEAGLRLPEALDRVREFLEYCDKNAEGPTADTLGRQV